MPSPGSSIDRRQRLGGPCEGIVFVLSIGCVDVGPSEGRLQVGVRFGVTIRMFGVDACFGERRLVIDRRRVQIEIGKGEILVVIGLFGRVALAFASALWPKSQYSNTPLCLQCLSLSARRWEVHKVNSAPLLR